MLNFTIAIRVDCILGYFTIIIRKNLVLQIKELVVITLLFTISCDIGLFLSERQVY